MSTKIFQMGNDDIKLLDMSSLPEHKILIKNNNLEEILRRTFNCCTSWYNNYLFI